MAAKFFMGMSSINAIDWKNIAPVSYSQFAIQHPREGETREMPHSENFQLLIPDSMHGSVGYSQVAKVTGGAMVFISGQVALDASGNLVGKDNLRAQAEQVFENLKAAVESAGGAFEDIIKLNAYLLDFSHLPILREVRDKYINLKNAPTSTAVQVSRLFRPEFLLEIEAVAIVGNR